MGVGGTISPGFEKAGAESEANDGAEIEAQAQDLDRLWAVGRRRG